MASVGHLNDDTGRPRRGSVDIMCARHFGFAPTLNAKSVRQLPFTGLNPTLALTAALGARESVIVEHASKSIPVARRAPR